MGEGVVLVLLKAVMSDHNSHFLFFKHCANLISSTSCSIIFSNVSRGDS